MLFLIIILRIFGDLLGLTVFVLVMFGLQDQCDLWFWVVDKNEHH
jgi:hypothetical protein